MSEKAVAPPPHPAARPWLQPNPPDAVAAAPKGQPAKREIPPKIRKPQKMPKIGDRIIFWRLNPAAPGSAVPVPADVYGTGLKQIVDGVVLDSLNLNVHEPGFFEYAPNCLYCPEPHAGCWCLTSDLK